MKMTCRYVIQSMIANIIAYLSTHEVNSTAGRSVPHTRSMIPAPQTDKGPKRTRSTIPASQTDKGPKRTRSTSPAPEHGKGPKKLFARKPKIKLPTASSMSVGKSDSHSTSDASTSDTESDTHSNSGVSTNNTETACISRARVSTAHIRGAKRKAGPTVMDRSSSSHNEDRGYYCHQCRRRNSHRKMTCDAHKARNRICGLSFCSNCIYTRSVNSHTVSHNVLLTTTARYRYPEITFDTGRYFECPKCRGCCNCTVCAPKRGENYVRSCRRGRRRNDSEPTQSEPTSTAAPFATTEGEGSWSDLYQYTGEWVGTAYTASDGRVNFDWET